MNTMRFISRRFELLALFFLAIGVSPCVQAIDIIAFNKAELAKHNEYRSLSGVPPLTYSSILAAIAQKYAELMVKTNIFQHSGTANIGENLYSFPPQGSSVTSVPRRLTFISLPSMINIVGAGIPSSKGSMTMCTSPNWPDPPLCLRWR